MSRRVVRVGNWLVAAALLLGASTASAAPATTASAPAPPVHVAFTKHPYVQALGKDRVVVRFELDGQAPARAEIGGKVVVKDDTPRTFFDLALTGLSPSTPYKAHVVAGTAEDDVSFTTAPPDDATAPIPFLIYGDNRTDDLAHAAVVKAMREAPGDFFVNTGDMVQDGTDGEMWRHFFDTEAPLLKERCLFAAVGNHELLEESATNFLRYFGDAPAAPGDAGAALTGSRVLFRTMRWGRARFFFLNGMDTFVSGDERTWLDGALATADAEAGLQWRIVVVHFGPWSSGPHGNNPRILDAKLPDMWRAHHVDLVLSGHDHIYERGAARGMKYIVSGGGGAPLYRIKAQADTAAKVESTLHYIEAKIDGKHFGMVVHRADGSILERCGFDQEAGGSGPWTCGSSDTPAAPSPAVTAPKASAEVSPKDGGTPPPTSRCACDLVGRETTPSWSSLGLLVVAILRGMRARLRRTAGSV